jgi:hypothetical protein
MKRTLGAVGLAALCLTWAASAVADVRVTYTVQDKALRAAVSGTNLTFTLFSDSGCTMQVGSPVTGTIDNVAIIERLKRFTPSGGTKGSATDRMVQVLAGVTPTGPVFLSVTGTGITPVGGACQFQFVAGTPLPCAAQAGTDVFFTGCNVNVRSGSGSTDGPTNGLGNLIVGYNGNVLGYTRPGSHNLVVGDNHAYTSYGGMVAGLSNIVSGPWATVSGGGGNVASGESASVNGGQGNQAQGLAASVSGGSFNTATGYADSVSGGQCNLAGIGPQPNCGFVHGNSSVSGGFENVASGESVRRRSLPHHSGV